MDKVEQDIDILRAALGKAGYTLMDRDKKPFWMKFQSTAREDWTGQRIDLTSWEDEISFASWTLTAIDGLSFLLTSVLMVIIAIGIMNSLWIAIRERTREIGTLRAIGMQRRLVLSLFVFETFFLGALGTAAGSLLGGLLAGGLHLLHLPVPEGAQFFTMSSTLEFALNPARVLGGAAVITACTTAVSLIPALKAARMKPVTAMSHI
jgi:ABC-type antimicrobial peptide transport system permease subunit